MEVRDKTKSVEAVVRFNKPLSYYEISSLVGNAVVECNRILAKERKKLSILKRIFTCSDVYYFEHDVHYYFSHDGRATQQRGLNVLNSEFYPDAKYETRYLMSIIGTRDVRLYFNVIPGIAKENQFGTEMSEKDVVSCITIKANLKSNLHWKQEQAKFLELLVPIIEKMNQKWNEVTNLVTFLLILYWLILFTYFQD